ncbi:N-6 DNA methylase [Amycolatopsis sp. cmx-4-54]|uniref:N-6 DNA methylase n=1 Tax=Amycolatopsis sp. cmx-4-54 TaxID=2790936 RepID=UPI00397D8052
MIARTQHALPADDPHERAQKIAERVDEVWHARHGHGELEIPVSVVAVLSLLAPPPSRRATLASAISALEPDGFADLVRRMWKEFVLARPDLVNRAWPLIEPWLGDRKMTPEKLEAACAVAHEMLRRDLFGLTDTTRWEIDLLGAVLTTVRTESSWKARGQYYTPTSLTDLIARLAGTPAPGESVNDPACGTGGMFRAAAAAMRSAGDDPATASWEGNDVDELAVACCAVNVVLWGLGTNVLLGVGNTLTADWRERALAERSEPVVLMKQLSALMAVMDLTDTQRRGSASTSADVTTGDEQ